MSQYLSDIELGWPRLKCGSGLMIGSNNAATSIHFVVRL